MLETVYIADKTLEELRQLFDCEIANDDDYYDVIAYNIAKKDSESIRKIIPNLDGKRLRAAIFGLGFSEKNSNNIRLLSEFLNQDDVAIVGETIKALTNIGAKVLLPKMEPLLSRGSEVIRAASIRFFVSANRDSGDVRSMLISALKDDAPLVRETAIDEIADLGDYELLNHILKFKNDSSSRVRQAALSAIEQLSG